MTEKYLRSTAKRRRKKKPKPKRKISTTKILMWAMIAIFFEMIIYAEVVMWITKDLTALYALIGIAASMFGVLWAYCSKSTKENTAGGIVHDLAMQQNQTDPEIPEEEIDGLKQPIGFYNDEAQG